MVAAAALMAFTVSFAAGFVLYRRACRGVGPSWEEWRDAEQIGGRWKPVIRTAASGATLVGLLGFGAPAPLRGALLGALVGFCIPFAVEGVRRYLGARRGVRRAT